MKKDKIFPFSTSTGASTDVSVVDLTGNEEQM